MPAQVLPTEHSFEWFKHRLLKRGFKPRKIKEFQSDFRHLEPKPRKPGKVTGFEAGFYFFANGLLVVVWTTFVISARQAHPSDADWVLIIQNGKAVYYSRPIYRTKGFLYNLLLLAAIARQRVIHRPYCPECGKFMDIVPGKHLKARFWRCHNPIHPRPINVSWDKDLPPEVKKQVDEIRQRREPYKKKLKAEGRKPGAALLERSKRKQQRRRT